MKQIFILTLMVSVGLAGCSSGPAIAWKSPASAELLQQLEAKTLEAGTSPARRAQLFFLWGQELAAQSRQQSGDSATGPSGDPAELRQKAIGAFEKVIDLGSGLVDESRINLEILLREQSQQENQNQQQQDRPNNDQKNKTQNESKPGQSPQPSPNDQEKGQQDQQSGKKDNPKDGQAKPARDLSSLVKDKKEDASLDQALKQDEKRKSQEQTLQFGSIVPVEKDW